MTSRNVRGFIASSFAAIAVATAGCQSQKPPPVKTPKPTPAESVLPSPEAIPELPTAPAMVEPNSDAISEPKPSAETSSSVRQTDQELDDSDGLPPKKIDPDPKPDPAIKSPEPELGESCYAADPELTGEELERCLAPPKPGDSDYVEPESVSENQHAPAPASPEPMGIGL